jgi:hypothetical protein
MISPDEPVIWQRSEIVRFLRWRFSWRGGGGKQVIHPGAA